MAIGLLCLSQRDLIEYRRRIDQRLVSDAGPLGGSFYLPPAVPESSVERDAPRGGSREPLRIGFCGSPRIEHRAHKVLQALMNSDFEYELVWLLDAAEAPAAKILLDEFGVTNARFVSDRSPRRWQAMLGEIDVAVHTLFSVFGDVSVYLASGMMAGLPCVVTKFAQTEHIPPNVVFQIEPGDDEAIQFKELFSALHSGAATIDPRVPREFAQLYHESRSVARELSAALNYFAPASRDILRRWIRFQSEARESLLSEMADILPVPDLLERRALFRQLIGPMYADLGWSVDPDGEVSGIGSRATGSDT